MMIYFILRLERFGDRVTVDCPSSAFHSKLDRFKAKIPENPPVGSYDQRFPFLCCRADMNLRSLLEDKTSFRQNADKAPFDSSSVRFRPNFTSRDLGNTIFFCRDYEVYLM